jgi:pilus assembly protein Flp/PilA
MKNLLIKLSVRSQILYGKLLEQNGQDLIEYGLVIALIAFWATASMTKVSSTVRQSKPVESENTL